ncbi:hypothetical protein BLNAU_20102 [Blattamonas nauphoetae]|uniref:Protein kinase domain-containing protein n=1 Tax=Blattamonas nauphoetae TaxID=2049346 RepID=A0ABQ9WZP4_9EUKA|nr:hypothetical protein BLNAU_20102 [Blattamonas nauphoetae]
MLPMTLFLVIGTSFDCHQHPVIALSEVIEEQLPNVEHTELPPVIRLNPGTYHGKSVPLSCRSLKLVGQEATSLVHSPLLPHHSTRNNSAKKKEFTRQPLYESILDIVNSTVEMTCVHVILSTETSINSKPFSGIPSIHTPYFGTILGSTVSLSECSISVSEAQSPFLLTSESSDSSPTSIRIVETKLLTSNSFLGPLAHLLPSTSPSSVTLTLASSSFSSTALTNGNSLAFGLQPHKLRVDDNWEISSRLFSNRFSNVTSTQRMPLYIPSQLSQWSLGNTISNCVGALQGTIMEDFNLGGTFLSKNTTFSHCESTPSPSLDIIVAEYYSHFIRRVIRHSHPPYAFNNLSRIESDGFNFFALIAGTSPLPQQSYLYATKANPISFTDCSFRNMSRDPQIINQDGLALYLQTSAPLTVTRCSFSDMRSEGDGLAITTASIACQPPLLVHIDDCHFSNCHSQYRYSFGGGALHFEAHGCYTISTSSFSECSTLKGKGGACYCLSCSVAFSTFEFNSAVMGGAFYGQTDCSIFFSHFQNNTAQTDTDWSFDYSRYVVCGCTQSADDWTIGDSFIVVSGDGEGTDCTKDKPCRTLANALTKVHSANIVNVESVTVPLFDFSSGLISLDDSQLENITSADCSLIKITTSAEFTMNAVLFRDIVSTDCVILILSGGKFTATVCIFHRLTRTEGEGAAAIDAVEFERVYFDSYFSHCISRKGRVGALFLTRSSKPDKTFIYGTYINNEGEKADDAHDILLSGFKLSDTNQWAFTYVFSMSQSPSIIENGNIHPDRSPPTSANVIDDDDWLFPMKDGSKVLLWRDFTELDFETLKPQPGQTSSWTVTSRREEEIIIHQSRLDMNFSLHSDYKKPLLTTIRQASDSVGSLFTLTTGNYLNVQGFNIVLDGQQTDPMITLDSSATILFHLVSVSSDGRELSRPFIQSMGTATLSDATFVNLAFTGTSCIECLGGSFSFQLVQSESVRCAVNLTTNVDGAFLNALNTYIGHIHTGPLTNCRARNGGAIFLRNCNVTSLTCVFVGCSASQSGGGLWMESNASEKAQNFLYPNFVNCSAERGGGMFFQAKTPFHLHLETGSATVYWQQPFALFSNCSAKKGAGIFLDGVCSNQCELILHRFTGSNGDCFCEGSDIFFSKSFAESLPSLTDIISDLKNKSWSLSSQSLSTGTKHVHIEDDLERTFNLEPRQFVVGKEPYNGGNHCPVSKNAECSNISPMFEFFHTKDENGSLIQIPILVKDALFFFETAFVERQSALLTFFDTTSDPSTATTFQKGAYHVTNDPVFLLVGNDGLMAIADLHFVWKEEVSLCEVVSPTAEVTIEACHFELDIDLISSFIVCRAGSLHVLGSQFTTSDPTRPILSPIVVTSPSAIAAVSNSARRDIKVEMDHIVFSDILADPSVSAIVSIEGGISIGLSHVSFENVKKSPSSENAIRISVRGRDLSNVIASKRESGFPSLDSDEDTLYTSLVPHHHPQNQSRMTKTGALRVVDGNVTLSEDTFSRNSAKNVSFPSASRNTHCSGMSVVNMKLNSADSTTQTSHWILTDDSCVVRDEDIEIPNPFFVPTLSTNDSSSKFDKKTSKYSVHLGGTLLLPCNLSLIVREETEQGEPKSQAIPLTQLVATDHTESSIDILVKNSHFSHFDQKLEWIGLIGFGRNGETDSFTFKLSQKQAFAESMRKTLPWLIPLIVSLALLLLVGFILFIVFRKRFLKKKTESKEMKEEVQEVFEVEKVEMDGTQQGVHANDPDAIISKDVVTAEQALNNADTSLLQPVTLLEAVICGEKLEKTVVREEDTLYNALHRKETRISFVKSTVRQQIVTGLLRVAEANNTAPILSKLSSHWVMFDGAGNVCLKLKDSQPPHNSIQVNPVEDGQRWAAPELAKDEATKDSNGSVDFRKSAVFSLGLVLWEIETGQVPFQEQDAVNAQRQLGTGVLPKMVGMQKEMRDLIAECLSLNPDDRPSLASVASLLQTLPEPSHENEKDNPGSINPQS